MAKETGLVIKNSEQRLADIIDFFPDATFVIDQTGLVNLLESCHGGLDRCQV